MVGIRCFIFDDIFFDSYNLMFDTNKYCQSCGIPWDKDPKGGGTNADSSSNQTYCSFCYVDGAFVQPNWTANDMRAYAIKVLAKKGIPEMLGKILTQGIPKLARWNIQEVENSAIKKS